MITEIKPIFVDIVPDRNEMVLGDIYISAKYATASHLCACGCGTLTVTPIGNKADEEGHEWNAYISDGLVTFDPSIENPECGAHYHITKNKISQA